MRIRKRLNIAVIVFALVFFVGSALAYNNGVEGGILPANATIEFVPTYRALAVGAGFSGDPFIERLGNGNFQIEANFDLSAGLNSHVRFFVEVRNTTEQYLPISIVVDYDDEFPGWLDYDQGVIVSSIDPAVLGDSNGNEYVPPEELATVWIEFNITEDIMEYVEDLLEFEATHRINIRIVPFAEGVPSPGWQPPVELPVVVPPGGGGIVGGGGGGGAFFPPTQAVTPPDTPFVPVVPETPHEPVLDVEAALPPIVSAEAVADDPPTPVTAPPVIVPPVVVVEADVDAIVAAEAETDGLVAIGDPATPLAMMGFEPDEDEDGLIAIAAPQIPLVGNFIAGDTPFALRWWMFLPLLMIPFVIFYNRNVAIAFHLGIDKEPIYVYIRRGSKLEIPEFLKRAGVGADGLYINNKFENKALWDFNKRIMLRKNFYVKPSEAVTILSGIHPHKLDKLSLNYI